MTIDAKFEFWLHESVVRSLVAAGSMAGVTVQFPGTKKLETGTLEEWCAVYWLTTGRLPSRANEWRGIPLLQVSSFSKFAERRADNKADAPWTLAGKVRAALEHQSISVRTIGEASETEVACVTIHEGQMVYASDDDEENHQVVTTFKFSLATN